MDQDAFRQLLATPAPAQSSSTPRPRWGAPPPKRTLPSTSSGKATDFAPRKAKARPPKKAPNGDAYRDRAAERRLGKEGDFADAEKMLQELKAREDYTEEQLQYLGGDAHHSVLVKGLDHALLARKKHEAALDADAELEDVEDALDEAFEAAPPPLPQAKKAKSRDELLAELKAMRAASGAEEGTDSRFKPIGADRKGKGKEPASGPGVGAGWKPLGSGGAVGDGEKKKRKKKKVAPPPTLGEDTATASGPAAPAEPTPPPPPPPAPALVPDEFDDDGDIFGDVGEYAGLGSDSDSDAEGGEAIKPTPAPPVAEPTAGAGTKRKYFDDDDDEDLSLSTAPSTVADLAAKQAAADAAAAARAAAGDGGDGEGEGDGEEGQPMRLQGLSSSTLPSVRDLLDMDKEAEAEEKRKAKKAKRREKAEERDRNLTDADRANRDFLEMQNYLSKKKEGKGE